MLCTIKQSGICQYALNVGVINHDLWHNIKRVSVNTDAKMIRTKNGRLMLSSKCAICGNKKSRFMKEQKAKGLLSNLEIKTLLGKIPLLGDLLF